MNALRALLALSMAFCSMAIVNPARAADISDRMIIMQNFPNDFRSDVLFDGTSSEGIDQPLEYTFQAILLPIESEQAFLRSLLPEGYRINIFLLEGPGINSDLVRVFYSGAGRIDINVAFYSDPNIPFLPPADETYSVLEVAGDLSGTCPACINIDVQAFPFFTRYNNANSNATIPYPINIQVGSDIDLAVPEPSTYAMVLAGLGLMGFMARRRKHKAA